MPVNSIQDLWTVSGQLNEILDNSGSTTSSISEQKNLCQRLFSLIRQYEMELVNEQFIAENHLRLEQVNLIIVLKKILSKHLKEKISTIFPAVNNPQPPTFLSDPDLLRDLFNEPFYHLIKSKMYAHVYNEITFYFIIMFSITETLRDDDESPSNIKDIKEYENWTKNWEVNACNTDIDHNKWLFEKLIKLVSWKVNEFQNHDSNFYKNPFHHFMYKYNLMINISQWLEWATLSYDIINSKHFITDEHEKYRSQFYKNFLQVIAINHYNDNKVLGCHVGILKAKFIDVMTWSKLEGIDCFQLLHQIISEANDKIQHLSANDEFYSLNIDQFKSVACGALDPYQTHNSVAYNYYAYELVRNNALSILLNKDKNPNITEWMYLTEFQKHKDTTNYFYIKFLINFCKIDISKIPNDTVYNYFKLVYSAISYINLHDNFTIINDHHNEILKLLNIFYEFFSDNSLKYENDMWAKVCSKLLNFQNTLHLFIKRIQSDPETSNAYEDIFRNYSLLIIKRFNMLKDNNTIMFTLKCKTTDLCNYDWYSWIDIETIKTQTAANLYLDLMCRKIVQINESNAIDMEEASKLVTKVIIFERYVTQKFLSNIDNVLTRNLQKKLLYLFADFIKLYETYKKGIVQQNEEIKAPITTEASTSKQHPRKHKKYPLSVRYIEKVEKSYQNIVSYMDEMCIEENQPSKTGTAEKKTKVKKSNDHPIECIPAQTQQDEEPSYDLSIEYFITLDKKNNLASRLNFWINNSLIPNNNVQTFDKSYEDYHRQATLLNDSMALFRINITAARYYFSRALRETAKYDSLKNDHYNVETNQWKLDIEPSFISSATQLFEEAEKNITTAIVFLDRAKQAKLNVNPENIELQFSEDTTENELIHLKTLVIDFFQTVIQNLTHVFYKDIADVKNYLHGSFLFVIPTFEDINLIRLPGTKIGSYHLTEDGALYHIKNDSNSSPIITRLLHTSLITQFYNSLTIKSNKMRLTKTQIQDLIMKDNPEHNPYVDSNQTSSFTLKETIELREQLVRKKMQSLCVSINNWLEEPDIQLIEPSLNSALFAAPEVVDETDSQLPEACLEHPSSITPDDTVIHEPYSNYLSFVMPYNNIHYPVISNPFKHQDSLYCQLAMAIDDEQYTSLKNWMFTAEFYRTFGAHKAFNYNSDLTDYYQKATEFYRKIITNSYFSADKSKRRLPVYIIACLGMAEIYREKANGGDKQYLSAAKNFSQYALKLLAEPSTDSKQSLFDQHLIIAAKISIAILNAMSGHIAEAMKLCFNLLPEISKANTDEEKARIEMIWPIFGRCLLQNPTLVTTEFISQLDRLSHAVKQLLLKASTFSLKLQSILKEIDETYKHNDRIVDSQTSPLFFKPTVTSGQNQQNISSSTSMSNGYAI